MNTNKKLVWFVAVSVLTLLILALCLSDIEKTSAASFAQQQKLVSCVSASDSFANDISISGNTAVVGSPNDNNRGSVFVFVSTGSSWAQQAKLTARDGYYKSVWLLRLSGNFRG